MAVVLRPKKSNNAQAHIRFQLNQFFLKVTNHIVLTDSQAHYLISPDVEALKTLFKSAHKHHTLRFIPRAARTSCRNLLTSLLKLVIEDPLNEHSWCQLLQFPFKILKSLSRGGRKQNTTKIIHKRIAGFYLPIDEEQVTKTRVKKQDSTIALAAAVTQKIECGNLRAAVRLLCQDEGLAPLNAETYNCLQDIHPARTVRLSQNLNLSENSLRVNTCEVIDQIKSFAKGSSGGPDLLTPQHLLDLINGPDDCSEFIGALTDYINIILAAQKILQNYYVARG